MQISGLLQFFLVTVMQPSLISGLGNILLVFSLFRSTSSSLRNPLRMFFAKPFHLASPVGGSTPPIANQSVFMLARIIRPRLSPGSTIGSFSSHWFSCLFFRIHVLLKQLWLMKSPQGPTYSKATLLTLYMVVLWIGRPLLSTTSSTWGSDSAVTMITPSGALPPSLPDSCGLTTRGTTLASVNRGSTGDLFSVLVNPVPGRFWKWCCWSTNGLGSLNEPQSTQHVISLI